MKRNTIQLILCSIAILLLPHSKNAQWIQTNGPEGGTITSFAVNDGNIFAGTDTNGVYLSTNNGKSWFAINSGLTNAHVTSLVVSYGNIFAGTIRGVFISDNKGVSWTAVNSGLTNTNVTSLVVSDSNIIAGTENGLFLSTNNGISWTAVDSNVRNGNNYVGSLAANGDTVFAETEDGFFLSTDKGANWAIKNSGGSQSHALVVSNGVIYKAVFSNGIDVPYFIFSTDNGSTWTPADSGIPPNTYIRSLAIGNGTIFAGTVSRGIFISTDNGAHWTTTNSGLPPRNGTYYPNITSLAINGNTIFAGTYAYGIFRSTDNGANWVDANLGIRATLIRSLAASNGSIFAGNSDRFFFSTNNGMNWAVANSGFPENYGIYSIAASGTSIVVGLANRGTLQPVYLSINNGGSWVPIEIAQVYNANYDIFHLTINGDTIFGTSNRGIFRSMDNGATWFNLNTAMTGLGPIVISGSNLILGSQGVYLSTDEGATWRWARFGLPKKVTQIRYYWDTIYSRTPNLISVGSNIFVGTDSNGIFLSMDTCKSWVPVNSGLSDTFITSFTASGKNIFVGTRDSGVFISTNNGADWKPVNSGLTNTHIFSLAVNDSDIFAGTSGSVWRRRLSEMLGITNMKPQQEIINQVQFKISTLCCAGSIVTIEFAIPHSNKATIKMYNLAGREISTLVNKYLNSGVYRYFWDIHTFTRGCYAISLQVGDNAFVKKIHIVH